MSPRFNIHDWLLERSRLLKEREQTADLLRSVTASLFCPSLKKKMKYSILLLHAAAAASSWTDSVRKLEGRVEVLESVAHESVDLNYEDLRSLLYAVNGQGKRLYDMQEMMNNVEDKLDNTYTLLDNKMCSVLDAIAEVRERGELKVQDLQWQVSVQEEDIEQLYGLQRVYKAQSDETDMAIMKKTEDQTEVQYGELREKLLERDENVYSFLHSFREETLRALSDMRDDISKMQKRRREDGSNNLSEDTRKLRIQETLQHIHCMMLSQAPSAAFVPLFLLCLFLMWRLQPARRLRHKVVLPAGPVAV